VAGAGEILEDPPALNDRLNSESGAALAGAVTFLVADLDAERMPWEPVPVPSAETVAAHRSILDDTVARRSGTSWYEDGNGAGVIATFARAGDALAAALEAQFALSDQSWSDGFDFRTRIALNTARGKSGDDGRHFAAGLSRCTQMRAVARGGQVVVSDATRELVVDCLPPGSALADLGSHRMGHGGDRQRVYRLEHPGLPLEPGPLRSLDSLPNNLPDEPTSFIGRRAELREIGETLASVRLLNLTGPGGSGKTRLALRVSAEALDLFPDGAWWVALGQVEEPALVAQAVARALGVRPMAGRSALEAVIARLASCRMLVILDNCEHVLQGAAETVRAILESCPAVTILATSREPLGVGSETAWYVPPLSLPVVAGGLAEAPMESDAVGLFLERMHGAQPLGAMPESTSTIAAICIGLEGIPLAIELAAARSRMLSLEQIATGLQDRFRLLAGRSHAPLSRHDTLWASVDWSFVPLPEQEQALLRRLAVFRGGFTLETCEAVASGEGLERSAVLGGLASLVDRSLVDTEKQDGVTRYRLLEVVRQYALERLGEAGELDATRNRHRDTFLELAEGAVPRLARDDLAMLELHDAESANYDAALDRAIATDPERALRLCIALTLWWRLRGLFPAGERSFARALEAANDDPSPVRAGALWGWSYLMAVGGNHSRAVTTAREALELAETLGQESTMARALHVIGLFQRFSDPFGSHRGLERSRALARAAGDDWCLIHSTQVLASSYLLCDDFEQGERLLEEVLPLTEGMGHVLATHWFCSSMGPFARAETTLFFERADRAVGFARQIGDPIVEAWPHTFMGHYELAQGKPDAALGRLEGMRERLVSTGAGAAFAVVESTLAQTWATLGDFGRARASLEEIVRSGADSGFQLAQVSVQLAEVLRVAGNLAEAGERARETLVLAERLKAPRLAALSRESLARVAAGRGEWAKAEALLHEALRALVERRLWLWVPQVLDAFAQVAAGLGSHEEAARLLGAVRAARSELGLARWPVDAPRFEELEQALRDALGDEDFEEASAAGGSLTLEQAAAWVRRARGTRKRPPGGWESLTPTELEVARHAAAGLTNPQIGERMFITRGTVKVHLSHIYAKLGIQNRAELAAEAARRIPVQSA
jgi:predicted ATPase/DNA-binding CsgD family transcriptional regulator